MNISKYIELLRFYVTDKIGQINKTVQVSLSIEIEEVLASILSAIFSLFISSEVILISGVLGTIIKVFIVITLYFLLKLLIKKIHRYQKSNAEQKAADKSDMTKDEAKLLVDRFDHIACDGMLLSREYLKKYNKTKDTKTDNERLFYLFEAFYYYKKALQITALIVKYPKCCFNNANNINGVSMYRFINIYNSLVEIKKELIECIDHYGGFEFISEFNNDMLSATELLDEVEKYIRSI